MNETPRVSIIIPGYNAGKYIGLTLDSVQAQTLTSWELVVLDDGSQDDTVAVCREYAARDPRIRVIPRENGGVAAARNRGFAETDRRSEFVIFLDNDDLWEPEALEMLAAALDSHPECVSAHALARSIDSAGRLPTGDDLEERLRERRVYDGKGLRPVPETAPTTFAALVVYNCIVSPGLHLMRRRAVQQVGGYDPATVPCDDWDYSLRLARLGDIAYLPCVLLNWRRHEANASDLRSARWRRSFYTVWRKTLSARSLAPEQRWIARATFMHFCRQEAFWMRQGLARRDFAGAASHGRRLVMNYTQWLRALMARTAS